MKISNRTNLFLLCFFSVFVGIIFYFDFKKDIGFILSINEISAILLLLFSIRIVFLNSSKGQFLLLSMLFFTLFNLISVNYTVDNIEYSSSVTAHIGKLSFNPIAFIFIIYFCIINRNSLLTSFFGDEKERDDKRNKLMQFYYDKFKNCTLEELEKFFEMFDDYPQEAQLALRKIHREKELSIKIF